MPRQMNIEEIKDKLGIGEDKVYAAMGAFETPEELVKAGRKIREMGYSKLDAMTPFPVHGIDDAIGIPYSFLGWVVICFSITGLSTALFLQWYTGGFHFIQALIPYGVSQQTFQCPLDMPPGPDNYDSTLTLTGCNSSYMWAPYSEGESTSVITRYTRRGAFPRPPSRIVLASDWQPVHLNSLGGSVAAGYANNIYAVYADGHAASTSHGYYTPASGATTAPAP